MRILVTGGAGYVGNELTYKLSGHPNVEEVVVYDNLVKGNYNLFTGLRKLPGPNVRFINGDILDSRSLHRALDGVDVVYHLAAKVATPFADQNPHDFEQTNHWGTAELVYALEDARPSKVVYLSSAAIYGGGIVESTTHPRNPDSYYGISKMRGEDHMLRLKEKLPVYIFRCANIYGYSKNLRIETLINQMIFDAHFTGKVTIHGDQSHKTATIDIKRVVDTMASVLTSSQGAGIYNLGHRNTSITDIVDTLRLMYPKLEALYVDQHLPIRSLEVLPSKTDAQFLGDCNSTLLDDLQGFKEMFTF